MRQEPTGTHRPCRWRIGTAVFDSSLGRVERDSNAFELDRSSLLVLRCLAEQAGEAVDKDLLLRAGWPGRTVTENSLTKAIGRVRQALGDEPGEVVKVVHGYGYRLVAATPIEGLAPPGPGGPALGPSPRSPVRPVFLALLGTTLVVLLAFTVWRSWPAWKAKATLPTASDRPSIAVLPFADLSPNHDQRYFTDGLSEQLIATLAQLPQLEVLGRTSSFATRDRGLDAVALGRELKVGTVLDGSVRKEGEHIRVTVQLIDTRTGYRLWSEVFDRSFHDLFSIQEEIARTTLEKLRVELLPEQLRGMGALHTKNPEAFERYLFAHDVYKHDETGGRRSLAAFERAVELDPGFYEAWVGLADTLGHSGLYADRWEEALEGKRRAQKALDCAITIAPGQPEAWLLRGDLKYAHWWDWQGAAADLEQGAKAGSRDRLDYLLRVIRLRAAQGHLEEAIALGQRASGLHPGSQTPLTVMGYHLTALGRYAEAQEVLTRAVRLSPLDEHAHYYLGLGKLLQGQPRESIAHFDDSEHVLRLTGLALAHYQLGDRRRSDQSVVTLRDRYGHILPYQLAEVHAFRGKPDLAFHWLERSCQLHDASLMYILWDPLLLRLHGDPRFAAILRKLNLPDPKTQKGRS